MCVYNYAHACLHAYLFMQKYFNFIFVHNDSASPQVAPSNLRVIDTTSSSVTFQWDALSNQQANGVVQQYVVTCTERNTSTEVSMLKSLISPL